MAFENCIIDPAVLPLKDEDGNVVVDKEIRV